MPANQTLPRRSKAVLVPAAQVKELLLKLAHHLHATKPVSVLPAPCGRR